MFSVDSRAWLALLIFIKAFKSWLTLDWVQALTFILRSLAYALLTFACSSLLLAHSYITAGRRSWWDAVFTLDPLKPLLEGLLLLQGEAIGLSVISSHD